MQDFNQKEKELREQVQNAPYLPFDKVFAEIEPRLKKKSAMSKKGGIKRIAPILTIAASIIIIFTGGLITYFSMRNSDAPPEIRYSDNEIIVDVCSEDELLSLASLNIFNFSNISDIVYKTGKLENSMEVIYFSISGLYDDGIAYRIIELQIVVKSGYIKNNENEYSDLPNNINIAGNNIFYSQPKYEEPFFSYRISFKIGDIKYYMDYLTIDEDDISMLFQEFII